MHRESSPPETTGEGQELPKPSTPPLEQLRQFVDLLTPTDVIERLARSPTTWVRQPATAAATIKRAISGRAADLAAAAPAENMKLPLRAACASPEVVAFVRAGYRRAARKALAAARRTSRRKELLELVTQADGILPGVSFDFARLALPHPGDLRLLEPLDLLEIAHRARGERKIRFLLRACREIAEHQWQPFLRALWPVAWVLKKSEPRYDPPANLGTLVQQLLDILPEKSKHFVSEQVLLLRNACSHTGSTILAEESAVRLADTRRSVVVPYAILSCFVHDAYRFCNTEVIHVAAAVGLRTLVELDYYGVVATLLRHGADLPTDFNPWPEKYRRWLDLGTATAKPPGAGG